MNPMSHSATASSGSLSRRFARWLFSWRTVRRTLLGLATFITLWAAFVTYVNVHGQRAWRAYQKQVKARGDRLDVLSLVPTPVPDDQNFAMTPLLAPLFDYRIEPGKGGVWRDSNAVTRLTTLNVFGGGTHPGLGSWRAGEMTDLAAWQAHYRQLTDFPKRPQPQSPGADVLLALSKFEAAVAELRTASQRPQARFALHYEEGMLMLWPHILALRNLQQLVLLRAVAELAEGQTDAALVDTRLALRLAESMKDEPLLVLQLKRAALLDAALQPLWEGLMHHQWSVTHLQQFEQDLAQVDLLRGLEQAIRCERNWALCHADLPAQNVRAAQSERGQFTLPEHSNRGVFRGYFNGNKTIMGQVLDERLRPIVNAQEHRLDPGHIRQALTMPKSEFRLTIYYGRHLAALLMPAVAKGAISLSARQAAVDQARVACALERYRLRHRTLPEAIEVLAPEFLEGLPHDLVTGQPMKYRRGSAGGFTLYSVGINEQDDGGKPAWKGDAVKGPDLERGDWVWNEP